MSLPTKLYRVVKTGGERLRYAERGGGTFTSLLHAIQRKEQIERREGTAEVWATETNWVRVK